LHYEELNNLYSSSNIMRMMGWVRYIVCIGEERNEYRIFVAKPE
jgi:hypothetical protein